MQTAKIKKDKIKKLLKLISVSSEFYVVVLIFILFFLIVFYLQSNFVKAIGDNDGGGEIWDPGQPPITQTNLPPLIEDATSTIKTTLWDSFGEISFKVKNRNTIPKLYKLYVTTSTEGNKIYISERVVFGNNSDSWFYQESNIPLGYIYSYIVIDTDNNKTSTVSFDFSQNGPPQPPSSPQIMSLDQQAKEPLVLGFSPQVKKSPGGINIGVNNYLSLSSAEAGGILGFFNSGVEESGGIGVFNSSALFFSGLRYDYCGFTINSFAIPYTGENFDGILVRTSQGHWGYSHTTTTGFISPTKCNYPYNEMTIESPTPDGRKEFLLHHWVAKGTPLILPSDTKLILEKGSKEFTIPMRGTWCGLKILKNNNLKEGIKCQDKNVSLSSCPEGYEYKEMRIEGDYIFATCALK